ncbi:hypothetical protein CVT26_013295 [Gymnopilus dilepis]|uniref:T6SS Phospholipase effector Tle1-like catalytic domain-containing protein n=1 Tax=Gymnopilus dilepis TaxID=231916 RepID=A0A409VUN4_9AGAR|nr:hypothetical protein CVT26_013295 [Gymnopilus dilepis]
MEENSKAKQTEDFKENAKAEILRLFAMECGCDMNGRCLVVSIDGTSNQFGEKNTNVIELYHLICKDDEDKQLTWYNSGIGTYARPSWKSVDYYKQVIGHKVDLAIAWNFEKTILGAYRWLSDNYRKGDRIFLFGFSRGAFQIRALSGMIHKVGLIYKGNELQIPFAYELYADPMSDEKTVREVGDSGKVVMTSMAERFKRAFSREDVKVHFVGAWDTVSSIGLTRGKKQLPFTTDGMKHVCYFRHALALDERRVKFLPEYAYGGSTLGPGGQEETETDPNPCSHLLREDEALSGKPNSVVDLKTTADSPIIGTNDSNAVATGSKTVQPPKRRRQQVKEVWFAGTHSDIGGGNVENATMDRSRPSLRWMVFEAEAVGLRTKGFKGELSSKDLIEVRESLTWIWRPFEFIPFPRLTFSREKGGNRTTFKPHLGKGRKIHPGQRIHASLTLAKRDLDETRTQRFIKAVLLRLPFWLMLQALKRFRSLTQQRRYTPKARPSKDMSFSWEFIGLSDMREWLEFDVYDEIDEAIVKFLEEEHDSAVALGCLDNTRISGHGRQPLYDRLISVLSDASSQVTADKKYRLLSAVMDILRRPHSGEYFLKLTQPTVVSHFLDQLRQDERYDSAKLKTFIHEFTDRCISVMEGGGMSMAYSNDGQRIVFGSAGGAIHVWNVETGEAEGLFRGYTEPIVSVALSPDGKCIVSGSGDKTIRLWDVKTGKQIGKPLEGHTDWVWSVAFSPDGSRIASGSSDKTVRLWDATTGEPIGTPMMSHDGGVYSVAFSPDGRHVASGSNDDTVRLWDTTGQPVGEPLRGHTSSVESAAFSPDGKHLVSGSWDRTIRLWNLESGEQDGRPFEGHTDLILSVAFSPDGKRIVSGSFDETVRLWNVETREEEGPPLRGHTESIWSVAFSPDGKHVASSSLDHTVRIWDLKI